MSHFSCYLLVFVLSFWFVASVVVFLSLCACQNVAASWVLSFAVFYEFFVFLGFGLYVLIWGSICFSLCALSGVFSPCCHMKFLVLCSLFGSVGYGVLCILAGL